ncbi:LysR family transcriptional regulator [Ramlibacter sp. 2FC]|uniref:LysR family transcriptional regulator n=1 Tax=Ramlibacter sp. 2FC TaxID=2502188 RepID=UPI0010F4803F|nr:LysR family transcriptional regulator [Ramlibacter sp. 2FC]
MDFNIARLDLVSMRLVVLCAETGSLSAAAKRAHCSISAGSQRLSALESTLGRPLFVRDHRGLHLTDAGKLFVLHARIILDQLEILTRQIATAEDLAATQPPLAKNSYIPSPASAQLPVAA